MKYIQKISAELEFIQHPININLNGRNLILTGKNGVGKTRFLNQLNNTISSKLIHDIPHISQRYHTQKVKIISILKLELSHLINDIEYINHTNNKLDHLNTLSSLEKLLEETDYYNPHETIIFIKKATELKNIILKYKNFSKNKHQNLIRENSDIYYIDQFLNEISSNHNQENINLVVTGIGNLNQSIQASTVTFNFFQAHRQSQIISTTNTVDLNQYINTAKHNYSSKLGQHLEQYLLNIKIEKSLALSEENNQKYAEQIDSWFKKFDEDLKFLFEDESTELKFEYKERKFSIKQYHREFTFQSLSSGFTAIFDIYCDLLMRSRLLNILPHELNGVVLIDEIDAHLHISLQKKILPFLTKSFPEVQFIVSTHSPFVITSTDNDTVVYDISSGEFFEEDLSHYSHESIIKELFHVQDGNENLRALSEQLLQFINSENQIKDLSAIQNLIDEISKGFEKLTVELQLQYMVAKNKLAKLKHKDN
ncbi:AAA family ATPase [uncultured Acinetobacter sp.]|uniref:AAA family ATPase n=1 Tax=uncultured Acinetobacter sp. TaxID=165433 RepID=UPI0025871A02|nr:AAA family ATPase [uncultured Acinetobacter sp.]